jgi:hypothetical protein
MSTLTQYVKSLYVENLLKLLHFALGLDCILYRRCVLEFISRLCVCERERERERETMIISH